MSFLLSFLLCCILFLGISFAVLHKVAPKASPSSPPIVAANEIEAFKLWIDTGEKRYTLDIKPQQKAAFLEAAEPYDEGDCDRSVVADKAVLRRLCERLGGIDYKQDGTDIKLTGQHLIDKYGTQEFDALFKIVLNKVFKTTDTLSLGYNVLTDDGQTDISYVDFYENAEHLAGITVY